MESLYACLKREIAYFQDQVERLKRPFDMDALGLVLRTLTGKHRGEIASLEKLRELTSDIPEASEVSVGPDVSFMGYDIKRFIAWLLTFVEHLRAMKEAFDEQVVVPLCEYLYVIEEEDAFTPDLTGPSTPRANYPRNPSPRSISKVANELFVLRRRWALMLVPGPIRMENFSLQNFAVGAKMGSRQFAKVQWLVPDLLYKSSVAVHLANQWVELHQRGNLGRRRGRTGDFGLTQMPPQIFPSQEREPNNESLGQFKSLATARRGEEEAVQETRAKLRDSRIELVALAQREPRARALEARVTEVTGKIRALRTRVGQERLRLGSAAQRGAGEEQESQAEGLLLELERRLRIENYHQRILLGDLLLELEIGPALIRYADMVKDLCSQHEKTIQAIEGSWSSRLPEIDHPTQQSSIHSSSLSSN